MQVFVVGASPLVVVINERAVILNKRRAALVPLGIPKLLHLTLERHLQE